LGAFLIGLVSGIFCYLASTTIKNRFGYDDSLDVFDVHGVGGFVGTVLVAIFASEVLAENQAGLPIPHQLQVQFGAGLGVALYIGIASWLIPKCVDMLVGLRLASDGTRRMMRRLDSI
jgi:Amt family ammonium transporter